MSLSNLLRAIGRRINRRRVERDMDAEMRAHVELEAQDLVRAGLTPEAARRQARLAFGGMERFKEEARDGWSLMWAANLLADVRYGLRSLRSAPLFTATAVLALALGIGANAFVFSFVDAVILRPLAVRDPDRIAAIYGVQGEANLLGFSWPSYLDLRRSTDAFSDLAAFSEGAVSVSSDDAATVEWSAFVSDNYFTMLGARPAHGTALQPGDLQTPVVVLGHAFWQRRFAANPAIIGRTLRINGSAVRVNGIMPGTFTGTRMLTYPPSVWLPAGLRAQLLPSLGNLTRREVASLNVLGRLRAGVDLQGAQRSADAAARQLATTFPQLYQDLHTRVLSNRTPINPWLAPPERFRWIGAISLLGVALVLFVACCNVTNLLLARMTVRRPEVAIRVSLGATRGRLIQQFLTESALLAGLGAVAAIPVAALGMRALLQAGPRLDFVMSFRPAVSTRVVVYTGLLACASVLVFGLGAALQASRRNTMPALRASAQGRASRRPDLREWLITAQVAVSVLVIVVGALFVQSLRNVRAMDPGFAVQGAVTFTLDPQLAPDYDSTRTRLLYARVLARLAELPGVRSVSRSMSLPLDGNGAGMRALAEDAPAQFERAPVADYNEIAPAYFQTLGTPLLEGREFLPADSAAPLDVVIINEVLARRLWPAQSALGRRVRLGSGAGPVALVVGVARASNYRAVGETPRPALWRNVHRDAPARTTFLVRARTDERQLVPAVRSALREIDPALPLIGLGTLEDRISLSYAAIKSGGFGALSFALLAALLAASGVYGVVSYAASQRRREIGIRVALGARPSSVVRLVVLRALVMTLTGVAIGLAIAAGVPMGLDQVLHGVSARDPLVLGAAAALFCAIASLAALLPAQRAARLDPVRALRLE